MKRVQVMGTGSALPSTEVELFGALGIDKPGAWLAEQRLAARQRPSRQGMVPEPFF